MLAVNERERSPRLVPTYNIMVSAFMRRPVQWLLGLALVACASCAQPEDVRPAQAPEAAPPAPIERVASTAAPRIVFLGDSLTAGYGLSKEESVPSLIQQRLRDAGYPHEVVNAGVSGDTSAGGLSRLEWSLAGDVRILVIELGANDGLRGLPVAGLKRNLTEIITRARARGITVVLTGMEAPPNFGAAYTSEFRAVYRATGPRTRRDVRAVLPGRCRWHCQPEHRRRHPPERRGLTYHREGDLVCPRAVARTARSRSEERRAMIELRNVSKTVQSGDHPLTILHPLDYTIHSGQFVAIVGPSGSGKSTLLGLLAGLDAPTTGQILIDGVDITTLTEDGLARLRGEKIGFVFQFFHLVPSLTAFENVLIPMEIAGRRDATARARQLRRGSRVVRSRASLSLAVVGRRAAAHRDCPGARQRSTDRAGGRADRKPRLDNGTAHHGAAAQRPALARIHARARDP